MQCSGFMKDFGGQFYGRDGIHLNGLGQYKLYRSLRGGGQFYVAYNRYSSKSGICKACYKFQRSSYLYTARLA